MPAEQVQGQDKQQAQKQDAGLQVGQQQQGQQQQQDEKAAGKSDPSAKNEQMTQGNSNLVPMEKGCKDKARVLDMQRRLVDLGFSTNGIDGDYGNGTVKALESFQKKYGLNVSGKADIATLEKLYELCPNPSIGAVSAKYESRGGDNSAVGYDSNGGTSYGKYQLAAKVGAMTEFVSWMKSNGYASLASKLEAAKPYDTGSASGACPTAWKAIATDLEKPVEEYVLSAYYTNAIKGKPYKEFIDESPTLRDCFYSASINHGAGGADTIVKRAYTPGMSKADFIRIFYQKRKEYVANNKYRDALVARYTNECSIALGLLELEEQGLIKDSNQLSSSATKAAEEEKATENAEKAAEEAKAAEAAKDNKNIEEAAPTENAGAKEAEPVVAININVSFAVSRNKAMGYTRDVWKEIQSAVGLSGDDVDGYVGPVTTNKIAEYQAANGLDVDGICGPKTLAAIRTKAPSVPDVSAPAEPEKKEEEVVTAPDAPEVEPAAPEVKEEAEEAAAKEATLEEEEPEVIPDGDWRADVIKAGLPAEEVYEGSDDLAYGHQKIYGEKVGGCRKVVGGVVKTGVASNGNAVKTLQALLNRSLKSTGLGKAQADFTSVQEAGTLGIDGSWGLNTATHLMYFIQMAGHTLKDQYISKFTVKCDSTIWQELRDKKSLDVNLIKQSVGAPLVDIPGSGGHKIVQGGEKAYAKMQQDSGKGLAISSSFRAFSSQGMAAAGLPNKSGQLELFALRVAGQASSDAAQPSMEVGSGSHMTGRALDLSDGKSWVAANGSQYGFTGIESEDWHFNFNPDTWAKSPKNN